MPLYDYRCESCGQPFEARHSFNDPMPACPHCASASVHREIRTAPRQLQGMAASVGSGGSVSKDQLRDKWAEETPKLREKLVSKLGEDFVNRNAPSLNTKYE